MSCLLGAQTSLALAFRDEPVRLYTDLLHHSLYPIRVLFTPYDGLSFRHNYCTWTSALITRALALVAQPEFYLSTRQQKTRSCRVLHLSLPTSRNCKDYHISLCLPVQLILPLQRCTPSAGVDFHVTVESSLLPPQLLGIIWNWCLYGALVVQFCENHLFLISSI